MQVTTIGLDLAKNVFQVHGITPSEEVVSNRPLRRAQLLHAPKWQLSLGTAGSHLRRQVQRLYLAKG